MKPIIITLLALPIVGFLHQTPTSAKATASSVSVAHKQNAKKLVPTSTAVAKPVAAPVVASQQPVPQAPAPIPTYPVGCQNYVPMISQYNWNVSVAVAIMQAESGCNPYNVSPAYINYDNCPDYGLFQIHCEDIITPASNIARAYQKYESQGWNAWSTYKSGAYLRFLQ